MYSSTSALAVLGLALAWTALNKSGIPAFDWYVSLVLIGLASIIFWARPRRLLCPSLPAWLTWTIRGLFLYLVFQAVPLPLGLLQWFSSERVQLTRSIAPIAGLMTAAPISVDPAAHALWFLNLAGCACVFFLVRDLTYRLQNRLFVAIMPLLLVSGLEGMVGLLQVAGGAPEAVGSYNGRDHYCCILEMTLPAAIAFGLVFYAEKKAGPSLFPTLKAIGCWLLAGILMLGILFSLSRAGWVDSLVSLLLLAVLVLFPRYRSSGWRLALLGGLVFLVFAIFLIASPEAMLGRLIGSLTPDSEGRLYIWRELTPLTREFRWFGTGLMGFDPVFLKYQAFINAKRIDFAHNDFLQYLIEMGLVGFVPLMISLGAIVWPIARGSWRVQSEKRLLLAGCVAGLFALFMHSLVDFNLYVPANVFAFAWILGFGSAVVSMVRTTQNEAAAEEDVLE